MIEGVGKSGASRIDLARTPVERTAPVGQVGGFRSKGQSGAVSSTAAEIASAGPPVDADKIAAIRAAIAEGRYPVDADKIAERMIELDLPSKF